MAWDYWSLELAMVKLEARALLVSERFEIVDRSEAVAVAKFAIAMAVSC